MLLCWLLVRAKHTRPAPALLSTYIDVESAILYKDSIMYLKRKFYRNRIISKEVPFVQEMHTLNYSKQIGVDKTILF